MAAADMDVASRVNDALLRPTWLEVDLDAITHNVRTVRGWLGARRLIGTLKGDACGFGIEECGVAMEAAGVDMVAVGNPFDVVVLRRAGVKCPIMLFGSFSPFQAPQLVTLGAVLSVVDKESAAALAKAAAQRLDQSLDVFMKVDTGLGRLGVPFEQAADLALFIARTGHLRLLGVYSHAGSSTDQRAEEQLRRLEKVLADVDALGIEVPYKVIASTPHVLKHPHMWLNAVDPGRVLFGIKQPADAPTPEGTLKPVLRALRTRLIQVKEVTPGDPPWYLGGNGGPPFWAGKASRYGVVPFGWGDVLLPAAYEKAGAIVKGVKVRFMKKFSTEHAVLDLSNVPDVTAGEVVTLIGQDGDACIDAVQIAKDAGVLVNDLSLRFHRYLPFVYFRGGRPVKVRTLAQTLG